MIGVEPGADLPEAAQVTLACMPNDGTALVRISVVSDEALPGGTVDLAALSVRYLDETTETGLALLGVDVNGQAAAGAEPLRIRFDQCRFDEEAMESAQTPFDSSGAFDRYARQDGRVRISMAALTLQPAVTSAPPVGDDRPPIRIAISAVADTGATQAPVTSAAFHPPEPAARAIAPAAGAIRIPTAALSRMQDGALSRGPRP